MFFLLVVVGCYALTATAHADVFGSGANAFEIEFVLIGDPGNAPDTGVPNLGEPNPTGSVSYEYRIGKYEVPEEAIRKVNAASELAGSPLNIPLDDRGIQKPATGLSWFDAARFVNWLNEEKGHTPAYKFDDNGVFQLWEAADPGYDPDNLFRNRQARYFLPSADEWYKAAFYDPITGSYVDFPTGSDEEPVSVAFGTDPGTAVFQQMGPADVMLAGGEGLFGTIGQAGNVNEWEETAADLLNNDPDERRGARGGAFFPTLTTLDFASSFRNSTFASAHPQTVGIRIVSIPEPSSGFLMGCLLVVNILLRPIRFGN